jgi:Uma2 family endonuclease
LAYDTAVKANLYAQSGITELWVVDVSAHLITVYRQPTAEGYIHTEQRAGGDSPSIQALANTQLKVTDILT